MYVSPSVGTSASSPQLHDSKRRGFAKSSTSLSRNWFRRSKGMDPKIPVYTLVHKDHTKASSSNRVDVIPLSNISAPPWAGAWHKQSFSNKYLPEFCFSTKRSARTSLIFYFDAEAPAVLH